MSTTPLKKLFLYGCILIGLGGFGFAQYEIPQPTYNCEINSDCAKKEINTCAGKREQCTNILSSEGTIPEVRDCNYMVYDTKPSGNLKPKKYFTKIASCECIKNKCETQKTIKYINPDRETYQQIHKNKKRKNIIALIISTGCISILLIIFIYKIKKRKDITIIN